MITKTVLHYLLSLAFLSVSLPLKADEVANRSCRDAESFVSALEVKIPMLMERYDIPGVNIVLISDGKVIWSEAFGYADLSSGRPMTLNTVCRMESLSKPVTAIGVMKLAEQGLIDPDIPVTRYLKSWSFPSSGFPSEQVTVRNLLSHTSGLPLGKIGLYYNPGEEKPGLREALARDAVLNREAGKEFVYSNTGFNLLELIVEEVTGLDFSRFMETEVLRPLGMNHSGYSWNPDYGESLPTGYDIGGEPVPAYVYSEKGAGGLFSTAEDYARFLIYAMGKREGKPVPVVSRMTLESMYSAETTIGGIYGTAFPAYGLGFFIETLPTGEKAVSHGGQGTGWMTHFHMIPGTGDGIIMLTNSQRSWPLFAHILKDWGEWSGSGKPGMTKILPGILIMQSLTVISVLGALYILYFIFRGTVRKKLRFSPSPVHAGIKRIFTAGFALLLCVALVSAAMQDYLVLTSLFPLSSHRLWYALLLLAFSLFFLSAFSYSEGQQTGPGNSTGYKQFHS